MRVNRRRRGLPRAHRWIWIIAICGAAGCASPAARDSVGTSTPLVLATDPSQIAKSPAPSPNADIPDVPRDLDLSSTVGAPASPVETWVIHTRACEQKIGTDPWASITIARFDGPGVPLHGTTPEALLDRMAGRTTVILMHGYGYGYRQAIEEAVKVRADLENAGGLPPETLFVVFDWPSERELRGLYGDLNEKARRTRIASYHVARFLQEAPPGAQICLLGQSDGGRLALTTMHLLSGAVLPAIYGEPSAQLNGGRPDLRFRCVIVDAAAGHNWLNPGDRLDQALPSCDALYNIYNSGDVVLALFIFGRFTGFRPAIGRVGLTSHDLKALGPLSARVEQIDLHSRVGFSHTLVPQALEFPDVAERVARYTSFSDVGSTIK